VGSASEPVHLLLAELFYTRSPNARRPAPLRPIADPFLTVPRLSPRPTGTNGPKRPQRFFSIPRAAPPERLPPHGPLSNPPTFGSHETTTSPTNLRVGFFSRPSRPPFPIPPGTPNPKPATGQRPPLGTAGPERRLPPYDNRRRRIPSFVRTNRRHSPYLGPGLEKGACGPVTTGHPGPFLFPPPPRNSTYEKQTPRSRPEGWGCSTGSTPPGRLFFGLDAGPLGTAFPPAPPLGNAVGPLTLTYEPARGGATATRVPFPTRLTAPPPAPPLTEKEVPPPTAPRPQTSDPSRFKPPTPALVCPWAPPAGHPVARSWPPNVCGVTLSRTANPELPHMAPLSTSPRSCHRRIGFHALCRPPPPVGGETAPRFLDRISSPPRRPPPRTSPSTCPVGPPLWVFSGQPTHDPLYAPPKRGFPTDEDAG